MENELDINLLPPSIRDFDPKQISSGRGRVVGHQKAADSFMQDITPLQGVTARAMLLLDGEGCFVFPEARDLNNFINGNTRRVNSIEQARVVAAQKLASGWNNHLPPNSYPELRMLVAEIKTGPHYRPYYQDFTRDEVTISVRRDITEKGIFKIRDLRAQDPQRVIDLDTILTTYSWKKRRTQEIKPTLEAVFEEEDSTLQLNERDIYSWFYLLIERANREGGFSNFGLLRPRDIDIKHLQVFCDAFERIYKSRNCQEFPEGLRLPTRHLRQLMKQYLEHPNTIRDANEERPELAVNTLDLIRNFDEGRLDQFLDIV